MLRFWFFGGFFGSGVGEVGVIAWMYSLYVLYWFQIKKINQKFNQLNYHSIPISIPRRFNALIGGEKDHLDAVLDLMSRWISVRPACFVVNKHRFFGCLINDLFDGTGIWRYDVIIFVRRTMARSRLSCQWRIWYPRQLSSHCRWFIQIPSRYIHKQEHFKCIFRLYCRLLWTMCTIYIRKLLKRKRW